jgi:Uma2 family endonuclease
LALTGIAYAIEQWARLKRERRGIALIDAYHRLSHHPDTTLGIDVSLISSRQWAAARHAPFVEGCPILAAKVISQSDTHGTVTDAVREYLDTGVAVVWVVNPDFETVSAFSRSEEPRLFRHGQELSAEPHLPGFRVRVAELFE